MVRDASPEDRPAIVAIYNEAIERSTATFDLEPVTVEQRQDWFSQFGEGWPLLVCEREGEIAGYAYYVPYRTKPAYSRTVEVTVYVHAAHRQEGVGRALYRELIDRARARSIHVLVAVIADRNAASEALHRAFGFVAVGRLREVGWKFGRWVDTDFWQLTL